MTTIPDFFKPLEQTEIEGKDEAGTPLPNDLESVADAPVLEELVSPPESLQPELIKQSDEPVLEQVVLPWETSATINILKEQADPGPVEPETIAVRKSNIENNKIEQPTTNDKVEASLETIEATNKRSFDEMNTDKTPQLIDITPKTFQTVKEKEPAFRRFAALVNSKTITLPKLYSDLLKRFDALETIMNYLQSRNQTCIFHKVKRSVEMQSDLSFELAHLGQIMYIYPQAYKLSPITVKISEEKVNSLSIEFITDQLSEQFVSKLNRQSQPLNNLPKLSTAVNTVDNSSLMTAVKEFAQQYKNRRTEFLKESNLKWDYNPLKPTFHPQFKLEDVQDIPQAELPLKKQISYLDQLKIKHGILEGKQPDKVELKKETEEAVTVTDEKKPISRAKALLERVV
ncbi:hypothetical protein HDV01_006998 [Terramyces sp. JEL0728]|nr:hypothetical protein HDV01_006998 [Terramyces sp. JEL0728]